MVGLKTPRSYGYFVTASMHNPGSLMVAEPRPCFSEPTYLQSFSKKHSTFRLHYSYKRQKSARWHGKRAERSCLPWFFFVTFFVSWQRKSIAVVLSANLLYWWFWKWSKPYNQLVTAYIGNLRPLRLSLQKKWYKQVSFLLCWRICLIPFVRAAEPRLYAHTALVPENWRSKCAKYHFASFASRHSQKRGLSKDWYEVRSSSLTVLFHDSFNEKMLCTQY